MIRKILIANRGEIAVRIIRTCQQMGIATVAVYSDADKNSLAVEMADEAFYIGKGDPTNSYLNIEKIILAAKVTGADAIHPGFGFLAENPIFAYQVGGNGLTFIGPSPASIEAMGDKRISKILLQDVPFVPGYIGEDQTDEAFLKAAYEIGFPIMVKASAGGGGKGMRLVYQADMLIEAVAAAKREALQAFGNDTLMLEKAIIEPRHIEVQVFGDLFGNIMALGERECSIQRRHQKIIEETPSTALTPDMRERICATAVSIAKQIGYFSAGTVEFLLDSNGDYYFMEMNTRLQVEHPVTEMVYGIDLVEWQIDVARGFSLAELIGNRSFEPKGHAIEVRVYAEDPINQFLPAIGKIVHFKPSVHARTDSGIRSGDTITTYYDPMIAKVIAHGDTRLDAIRKLDYALSQTELLGLTNNIAYLRRAILTPEHLAGIISTRFVEEHHATLTVQEPISPLALIATALVLNNGAHHWRNNTNRPIKHTFRYENAQHVVAVISATQNLYKISVDNRPYDVELISIRQSEITLTVDGHYQRATVVTSGHDEWWVHTTQATYRLAYANPLPYAEENLEQEGSLRAPMPGKITKVIVSAGDHVEKGALLIIMEAMKMEHRIEAPTDGIVESIRYQVGDTVQADEVLLSLIEGRDSQE